MPTDSFLPVDPAVLVGALFVLLGLLIFYYVLMVRALLGMLRLGAHSVIIVFTYLSLIPFPLIIILGINNLIIWRYYKPDLEAAQAAAG